MEKTYEIPEVLKSLYQVLAMSFLGLLTKKQKEMPGTERRLKLHTQITEQSTQRKANRDVKNQE